MDIGTNHRGQIIPGNHRPTPRLARAYRQLLEHAWGEKYSDAEAQEHLNDSYRDNGRNANLGSHITIDDVVNQARGTLHPDRLENIGSWMFPDHGGGPSGMSHDRTRYTY